MNRSSIIREPCVYLGMALFWLIFGTLIQIYWDELAPRAYIPVSRTVMLLICFVLFSYSFVRWRLQRTQEQWRAQEHASPPPRPRVLEKPNPDFDFSDKKSEPEA